MADREGVRFGVFDYDLANRFVLDGLSVNASAARTVASVIGAARTPADPAVRAGELFNTGGALSSETVTDYKAAIDPGPHAFWFEHVISIPQTIELGNVLTTLLRTIEFYNSWRERDIVMTDAQVNAGEGIDFVGLGGLPVTLSAQNALTFQVRVTTEGPPEIDGTLDFIFDVQIISIPISGIRIMTFFFEPEAPITETLEFVTGILEAVSGDEQRARHRQYPRQVIELQVKLEEGHSRRLMQSLVFGFQPGTFGLPLWYEAKRPTQDINATDTTLYLDTRYSDYRVEGLVFIWESENKYEALEIGSMTDSSLTLSSPVANSYNRDTCLAMPLRAALTEANVGLGRYPTNMDELSFRFTTIANESNIASTAAFPVHNGKVMLDDPNFMESDTLGDSFLRRMDRLDNAVGNPVQYSDWHGARFVTNKGFVCNSFQSIWEVRQLVHALGGSQLSFYLPTFYTDLVVVGDLSVGSFLMDIEHIGYSDLIQANEPNKSVWIELHNGTILTREVVSHSVISTTVERLTMSEDWDTTITPAEIRRVSFLRLCRIADDRVSFVHQYSGSAKVTMSVLAVRS